MKRTRSQISRDNDLAGKLFEAWIERHHEAAYALGILVCAEKNEPHTFMEKGELKYESPGVADYTGTFVGGGTLATEAKSTSGERFYKSEVKPKQQKHLDAVARAGGNAHALLLVEFRFEPGTPPLRFAIPWAKVAWRRLRNAESVAADEISSEWLIVEQPVDGKCYLSKFHPGGPPVQSFTKKRVFAAE